MNPVMIIKCIVTLLSVLLTVISVKAQSNLVFYSINDQFNSSGFNPAFLTSQQNYTFSIFPMSEMSLIYNNQTAIMGMTKKLLPSNQSDTLLQEQRKEAFTDLYKSLADRDLFYQRFDMTLLSIGYNSAVGSFNFRIKEVEQMMMDFRGRFSRFLMNPTSQSIRESTTNIPCYGLALSRV